MTDPAAWGAHSLGNTCLPHVPAHERCVLADSRRRGVAVHERSVELQHPNFGIYSQITWPLMQMIGFKNQAQGPLFRD